MERSKKLKMLPILALMVVVAAATIEQYEKDCADQLANLAACIPFVSGTAKKPTPQCCEDTQKVKSAKPKCLCVLIKESTDPSMGLPVNTTLALQMPSGFPSLPKSNCCLISLHTALLNLPPDSADAKIFQTGSDSSTSSTTNSQPTSDSTSSGTSSSSSGGTGSRLDSKATPSNSGVGKLSGRLLGMIALVSVALILV